MSHHLKRIAAPRTWTILRKAKKFIAKPLPGPHNQRESLPVLAIVRDLLGYAETSSEVRQLLLHKKVLVDGRFVRNVKFPVGLFDIISFPDADEYYRLFINTKNKLYLNKVSREELQLKLVKIMGKKLVKGKRQYSFNDGRTMLSDENYNTSDSLLIKIPEQKVLKHLPFEVGNLVYLTAGNHVGEMGKLTDIVEERGHAQVIVEGKNGKFETLKKYAFVVGKDKPEIKINVQ